MNLINDKSKLFTALAFPAASAVFCSTIAHVGYISDVKENYFSISDYENNEILQKFNVLSSILSSMLFRFGKLLNNHVFFVPSQQARMLRMNQ